MTISGRPHRMGFFVLVALALVLTPCPATASVAIDLQTSNPTPVAGGAAYSYTVTLTNGASVASNVVMTMPLPADVVFYGVSIGSGPGYSCQGPPVGTNGVVACTAASVAANNVATVPIVVAVPANLPGGVRVATARVVSGGVEASDSVQNTVGNSASVALSMVAPATVIATNTVVYDLQVANSGSSAAVNVLLVDPLPANTSFVSVNGANGFAGGCYYEPAANEMRCSADFLGTGTHHVTLVVKTAKKPRTGLIENVATLQASIGGVTGSPANATTTLVKK